MIMLALLVVMSCAYCWLRVGKGVIVLQGEEDNNVKIQTDREGGIGISG